MDVDIPIRPDGLQLDESRSFQRASWVVQRATWGLCLLVVVLALSGITGRGGPLALQEHATAQGAVSLPRVTRRGSTDEVAVTFTGAAAEHRLFLPHALLSEVELRTTAPRALSERAVAGGVAFTFAAEGPPPHRAALHLRARHVGLVRSGLTIDGAAVDFTLLTLP